MKTIYSLALTTASMAGLATGAGAAILPVDLSTAGDFAILAKSAITTTAGSAIVGDLGISPAAATDIAGFNLIMDASGQFSTSALVTGKIFAASYGGATETKLTTAVGDMQAAYTDAANRSNPDFLNLAAGNLNGETLTPGLYKWGSGVTITDSVTINGGGDSNAVWIFQIDNRLNLATDAKIFLAGGAQADNIFWQTAEGATLGVRSHFEGNLLTMTDVAAQTDATMNARLLAQTGVTLDSNDLTVIPEPSTYAAIFGFGALAFVIIRRRMKKAA